MSTTPNSGPVAGDGVDHRIRFEPGEHSSVVVGIVEALEAATGIDYEDLEVSLYEAIDPEALESMYRHARESDGVSWTFEFTADGFEITVRHDGRVTVR